MKKSWLTILSSVRPCPYLCLAGPSPKPLPENPDHLPGHGGNINKNIYTDYQGKRIYFCCAGCDQEFKKIQGNI